MVNILGLVEFIVNYFALRLFCLRAPLAWPEGSPSLACLNFHFKKRLIYRFSQG